MIVAGSVLTLLLMGLAVDGFVTPADEEPDDDTGEQEDGSEPDDGTGSGNGLLDLLDANGGAEDGTQTLTSAAGSYTPIDQIEPDDDDEALADSAWMEVEFEGSESDFIDIYATTQIGDGQDVPYVASFDPDTDTLILEFVGLEADAPEIDVNYDEQEDASIVSANGVPVTLVEGIDGMTEDNVTVVMTGEQPEGEGVEDDLAAEDGDETDDDAQTATPEDLLPDPTTLADAMDDDTMDRMENVFDGEGEDITAGTDADDSLTGGDDDDVLASGMGDDTLDGGEGSDLVFGGEGDDMLSGGDGDDFLHGGLGADTLDGGAGDDTLSGVEHDGMSDTDEGDTLIGGDGDDRIILGQGDTAEGGEGADTFTGGSYIEMAEVAGHVSDFNPAEDRIEVIFDPDESPDPTLEVLDFEDGSGADIILDGQVILSVSGAQGLNPNMIDLQPRA